MPSFNSCLTFAGYRHLTDSGVTISGRTVVVNVGLVAVGWKGWAYLNIPSYTSVAPVGIWRVGSVITLPNWDRRGAHDIELVEEIDFSGGGSPPHALLDPRADRTRGGWTVPLTIDDARLVIHTYIRPYDMQALYPFAYRAGLSGLSLAPGVLPQPVNTSKVYGGPAVTGEVWAFQRDLFHSEENVGTLAAPVYRVRSTCVWVIRENAQIHAGLTLTDPGGVNWNVVGIRVLHRGRVWALDCRAID